MRHAIFSLVWLAAISPVSKLIDDERSVTIFVVGACTATCVHTFIHVISQFTSRK